MSGDVQLLQRPCAGLLAPSSSLLRLLHGSVLEQREDIGEGDEWQACDSLLLLFPSPLLSWQ